MRGGFLKSFLNSDVADSVLIEGSSQKLYKVENLHKLFFPEVIEFLHVAFKLMQKHGLVFFPLVFTLCHFPISIYFRLGNARWYCITKSSIFSHAALFFCFSADFLSKNFTGTVIKDVFTVHRGVR